MRRAAALLALLPVGCAQKLICFGDQHLGIFTKEVETPTPTPASEASAARVHEVGRKLLIASPFAGIEPSFQVVGCKGNDWVLCHRDQFGVFVSDKLADRCASEDELAGVLASELGQMIAERRNLVKMGVQEPDVPKPTGEEIDSPLPATTVAGSDPAAHESKLRGLPTEPKAIAAELLKAAGYEPSAQASAEPILRKTNRNRALVQQLAGPAAAPKWSN